MNVDGGAGTAEDDEDVWLSPLPEPEGLELDGTERKSRKVYALRQRSSLVVKIDRR